MRLCASQVTALTPAGAFGSDTSMMRKQKSRKPGLSGCGHLNANNNDRVSNCSSASSATGPSWHRRTIRRSCVTKAYWPSSVLRGFALVQEDEGLLRLDLPSLRRLDISWRYGLSGRLRIDRESFAVAAGLKSLSLVAHMPIALMPDCFTRLTALSTLKLGGCGLIKLPTALTALESSLTSLSLPWNNDLQLGRADVAILVALRKLQYLDLRKFFLQWVFKSINLEAVDAVISHLRYEPGLWSHRSLQHLVDLPGAFSCAAWPCTEAAVV